MSLQTTLLTPALYHYLLEMSLREEPELKNLREATVQHFPTSRMQTAPEQAQLISLLIKLMGAHRAIDVGTFTGHSALTMALALPEDGEVITCERDPKVAAFASNYFKTTRVGSKINLQLGAALDTLRKLVDQGYVADFIFIDADKPNMALYYETALSLVARGGLIAIDNVLWDGDVIDSKIQDASTQSIRNFNQALRDDKRVDISLVPIGDGLFLARKK